MKDKLKSGGDAIKSAIKAGGEIADKVLDKGTDVATAMMNHTAGLISKLSDDIGVMADRILATEDKIGSMADRVVRTEELMAKLTATLAGKDLDLSPLSKASKDTSQTVVIRTEATEASGSIGPKLIITGDPRNYLMYVSTSPLFQDGRTVISKVTDETEYDAAWKRSIIAVREVAKDDSSDDTEPTVVSLAVKTITEDSRLSAFSNSVDVQVYD